MSILLNDQITIVDLHNCLSISRSMLIKITDMLLEYGYIKKESVACRSKCKDVWVINDNLFQSSDTTEKTYYREIND
jgi:predicted transcriptional regulator